MLVISRKVDESIRLTVGPEGLAPGTQLYVMPTAYRGDSVRLGVSAPPCVYIERLDRLGNVQHNPRPDCDRRGAEGAEDAAPGSLKWEADAAVGLIPELPGALVKQKLEDLETP